MFAHQYIYCIWCNIPLPPHHVSSMIRISSNLFGSLLFDLGGQRMQQWTKITAAEVVLRWYITINFDDDNNGWWWQHMIMMMTYDNKGGNLFSMYSKVGEESHGGFGGGWGEQWGIKVVHNNQLQWWQQWTMMTRVTTMIVRRQWCTLTMDDDDKEESNGENFYCYYYYY